MILYTIGTTVSEANSFSSIATDPSLEKWHKGVIVAETGSSSHVYEVISFLIVAASKPLMPWADQIW